jgi:hypothetical protein
MTYVNIYNAFIFQRLGQGLTSDIVFTKKPLKSKI